MGGVLPVKPIGKIFLVVICVVYILVGILLFVSSVIYLKQGFGIGDEGYQQAKADCKNTTRLQEEYTTPNFTITKEDVESYCSAGRIALAAICFAFILSVLLVIAGVFLILMVFKGLCVKRWFLVWLIIALILALLSIFVLLLLFLASINDGLDKICQGRHIKFQITFGRELKPPCSKGNNFVAYRQYPECFRSWQKFENYLKKLWRLIWWVVCLILLLNVLALIAFLIIYCLCKKKAQGDELTIVNLPPNISEKELKKKFPGAIGITIDKRNGTAKIIFPSMDRMKNAIKDSGLVRLGPTKVGWLRPEELYIANADPEMSADDFLKEFPNSKSVKFQNATDPDMRIATVVFGNESDQKKAYDGSKRKKIGAQQLDGGYGGGGGGGKDGKELQISNLPSDVDEDSLKNKFKNANGVKIDKGSGTAKVYFDNDGDAAKAYEDSDMIKLGKPKLGYLKPEEFYVQGVPKNVKESDLLKNFPTAKGVKFQNGEGGQRIAIMIFPNEAQRVKAYEDSDWTKLGPQKLGYGGDGGSRGGSKKGKGKKGMENEGVDIEDSGDLSDDELAKKLWKTPDANYSNLSNLFHPKLYILNLPAGATRKQLLDIFETAEKVDIKGKLGILEFESPTAAAHAFNVGHKKTLNGQSLKISIHAPKGKGKGKSRKGSGQSSKSGKSGKMSKKSGKSKSSKKSKKNQVGAA